MNRYIARLIGVAAVWACLNSGVVRVEAQQTTVAVLPWFDLTTDPKAPGELTDEIVEASSILERMGYTVLDPTLTRMRLLAYGRFPAEVGDEARKELESLARRALVSVARLRVGPHGVDPALLASAQDAVKAAVSFAEERIEIFNRDDKLAKKILDTCLLTPRLLIAEGSSQQLIVMEALRCMKMSPGVTPSSIVHPPEVRAALARADRLSASLLPTAFEVSASDCPDCTVLLNGRPLGKVPYTNSAIPGTYLIQVEAPEQPPNTGLVHSVTLTSSQTARVHIEPFERRLRKHGETPYVPYEEYVHYQPDLKSLMSALNVNGIVLLRFSGTSFAYEMLHPNGSSCPGVTNLPANFGENFTYFVRACTPEGSTPGERAPQELADAEPARKASSLSKRPRSHRNLGITLMTLGVGSILGAGLANWKTSPDASTTFERGFQALAAGGAVMASLSEPLWMPLTQKHAPWWAWTGMALGIAPVVRGVWLRSLDGKCHERDPAGACMSRYHTRLRSTILLSAGAPLLLMPIGHYVARAIYSSLARPRARFDPPSLSVSFEPSRSGSALLLRGSF